MDLALKDFPKARNVIRLSLLLICLICIILILSGFLENYVTGIEILLIIIGAIFLVYDSLFPPKVENKESEIDH